MKQETDRQKRYKCPVCNEAYYSPTGLAEHVLEANELSPKSKSHRAVHNIFLAMAGPAARDPYKSVTLTNVFRALNPDDIADLYTLHSLAQ